MTIHNQSMKPESDVDSPISIIALSVPIYVDDPIQENRNFNGKTIGQIRRNHLGALMSEKRLAIVEGIVSCMIIVCGIIASLLSPGFSQYMMAESCKSGTAIWAGLFGILSAVFGLSIAKYGYKNKILLLAHFAICLINAITLAVLIALECVNVSIVYYCIEIGGGRIDRDDRFRYDGDDLWISQLASIATFVMVLKISIIICVPIKLISNIGSFVRVCSQWKNWVDAPTLATTASERETEKQSSMQTMFKDLHYQLTTCSETPQTNRQDAPVVTVTEKTEKEDKIEGNK